MRLARARLHFVGGRAPKLGNLPRTEREAAEEFYKRAPEGNTPESRRAHAVPPPDRKPVPVPVPEPVPGINTLACFAGGEGDFQKSNDTPDLFARAPDGNGHCSPLSQNGNGQAAKIQEVIARVAAEIHQRHPRNRRDCSPAQVAKTLAAILKHKHIATAEQPSYLEQINGNHTAASAGEAWRKDGGQFAKGLEKWLAPTKERYDVRPEYPVASAIGKTGDSVYSRWEPPTGNAQMPEALPCNLEVERLVLGSLLLDESLLYDTRPVLVPEDFMLEKHRRILRRVAELYDAGRHVDHVTTAQALIEAGELESCDGVAYLIGLQEGLPLLPDLSSYVRILKDETARRRIIAAASNVIQRAKNRDNPQIILDSLAGLTADFASPGKDKGLVSARELVDRVGITAILAPRVNRGVPFPWRWLTNATCGMLAGELWILAAHTSAGKTSAAIETAVHVARTQLKAVAVFSLEMGDVSVFQRAAWQLSRVDSERAKRGLLNPEETKRAAEAVTTLYELPLYFDDGALSVMEIHAGLRRLRARGPLGLVVIDYLRLLRDGRHNTRTEAVGSNARAMKLLASEFECPVLLLLSSAEKAPRRNLTRVRAGRNYTTSRSPAI